MNRATLSEELSLWEAFILSFYAGFGFMVLSIILRAMFE